MGESQTFEGLTQDSIEEHKQIHFYLDQMSRTLESLKQGLRDVEPMRRLAAEVQGLKERLKEHHDKEETGGLFEAVLAVLPAQRVEIDRLTNQHEKMIEILEMARIHASRGDVGEADALREDLENFLEMFRRHEESEEQLLKEAVREERASTD
jgi:hemerythrin-like domain-containing protein